MKYFKILSIIILCSIYATIEVEAQENTIGEPIEVVKRIGNKLIKDTPFKYELTLASPKRSLNGVHSVDFGRTYQTGQPSIAYAFTQLKANEEQEITLELAHNDGCKIWLNNELIYESRGRKPLEIEYAERSVKMPNQISLSLKSGVNNLLIKSQNFGNEWVVYFQPIKFKYKSYPEIGLKNMPYVNQEVSEVSDWLIVGPFLNKGEDDIDIVYPPENGISFGSMYNGIDCPVTWTIPKVEVLGDVIDKLPWGTNYNWNYHNGGVAWAMQNLAEVTCEEKYAKYATDFCDFHLKGAPFVNYQVKTLREPRSANWQFEFAPLLDYTLAPALPFIYRLRKNTSFENREEYEKYIGKILKYAKEEQIRLPGSGIFTRVTPEVYTTWVDDMFMGIPFLMQAAKYVGSEAAQKLFFDDAANQAVKFNEQVWDKEANLYMHAKYSERDVKLPHWSRANGWGIWATTEVLRALPQNHSNYKTILKHYQTHVDALVKLQNENGFWLQLLDRPDSREEVSGTAIFVMAIARGIRLGWLNSKKYMPYALKGWKALETQVGEDGTVYNICYGTMCSEDEEYYRKRPFYENDTHGLFAVLFAGIEMHKLLEKE